MTCSALPRRDRSGGQTIVTSPYGMRWGRLHGGTDLGTTDGIEIHTPVHAREDAKVVGMGHDPGGSSAGKWLWTLGDNGKRRKFFHLNGYAVGMGARVRQGDVIAFVGMTGTSAPHLHEEEHAGSWQNPVDNTPGIRADMAAGRWPDAPPPPPPPPEEPEDMGASIEDIRAEFVNQDARMAAWLQAAFAAQTAKVVEAVGIIQGGGIVNLEGLRDDIAAAVADEFVARLES